MKVREIIERVKQINPEAGAWLESDEAITYDHAIGDLDAEKYGLDELFFWVGTPQGHAFWQDINEQIGALEQ